MRTKIENVANITLIVTETLHVSTGPGSEERAVAKFCLLLPGKTLHISALLAAKRFRNKGNKDGAVKAITLLQEAGIGKVTKQKAGRGTLAVSSS